MPRSEPTPDRRTADRPEAADRRARPNLRELCDEVLASHRAATANDPISADDREAAAQMLPNLAPLASR